MLTPNSSCTLYLQAGPGAYTRVYVPACFWQEGADGTLLVIPIDAVPASLSWPYEGARRERSYVVQGECADAIGTDSKSLQQFLTSHRARTIKSVERLDYGGIAHYEVTIT